jgi:hypothetical protein
MNTEDGLPLAGKYAADVADWLATTNLSGLAETGERVELPAPGAPVTVVRPVRLPYEMDALVKALAEARGVSMSSLIRDWITAGLAVAGQMPDPVTELRHSLDVAQRALDSLTDRAHPGRWQRPAA